MLPMPANYYCYCHRFQTLGHATIPANYYHFQALGVRSSRTCIFVDVYRDLIRISSRVHLASRAFKCTHDINLCNTHLYVKRSLMIAFLCKKNEMH